MRIRDGFFLRLGLIGGLIIGLNSLGVGCSSAEKSLCSGNLLGLGEEIDLASQTLQNLGRMPASAWQGSEDVRKWQGWSEDQLRLVQDGMDQAEVRPEWLGARAALSRVGNELVFFYGYSNRGDLAGMKDALTRARSHLNVAQSKACAPRN